MIVQTFLVAFFISYVGSIPPGTINISVMQLAMKKKKRAALFFGLAAAMVEFVYAGLTVQFHIFLNENEVVSLYFKVVTAVALVFLGLFNLRSKSTSSSFNVSIEKGREGFLRGALLGFLNPMTIPFWLAITTYLENDRLIDLTGIAYWIYLIGLSTGTYALLVTVVILGSKFTRVSDNDFIVHKVPGIILVVLGIYFLAKLVI